LVLLVIFFFQAEDGIRDATVTGVQTCALPISEINRLVDAVTLRKPCDTTGTATDAGYSESAYNFDVAQRLAGLLRQAGARVVLRSEERRVGKECGARRSPYE